MRRRDFIVLAGGAALTSPVAAMAQQPAVTAVGVLRINPREVEQFATSFRSDMRRLGWEEGRNIRYD
jgi:hypothetical protein